MAARKDAEPVQDPRKAAFRIKAGTFKAALSAVVGVIVAKATVPIIGTVRITAADGLLTLAGTDLDIWAERTLGTDDREPHSEEWRASIKALSACVSAHALLAILGAVDADAIMTVEAEEARVLVMAGRGRWRLPALPVADFPEATPTPWVCHFDMKASALADAFAAVDHAICSEEARYYLNGVYWHAGGLDLRLAATDGHRLARLALDAPEGAHCLPACIIPRHAVALLGKLLPKAPEDALVSIEVNEGGSRLFFEIPQEDDGLLTIQTKAIDGTFPDYTRVIPQAPEHGVTVVRELLIEALRGAAALATKESQCVKVLAADGVLTLSWVSADVGEAVQEVPCVYEGPELTWGFNGKYWREALGAIASDEVRLRLSDEGSPVLIEGVAGDDAPRLIQCLMPMRI